MIQIVKTEDIDSIAAIHKAVFEEEFPREKYLAKKRNSDSYIIYDGSAVGYSIVRKNIETLSYYLWMGGVLEDCRQKGYWSQFIDEIIVIAQKEGYKTVSLATYNHRPEMLRVSIKKGFKIVGTAEGEYGDKVKILLEYTLANPQETRIILSNKCNFKCFFCHMEGVKSQNAMVLGREKLEQIIYQCRINNCETITLTGGEPLIDQETLAFIIKLCNDLDYMPHIKIITNGSLITESFITIIKSYKGKLGINISLHSTEEPVFNRITQSKSQYTKTLSGIALLVRENIDFRINYVVLKGVNDTTKNFENTLMMCMKQKIKRITFLELFAESPTNTNIQYVLLFEDIKKVLESASKEIGELSIQFENEKKIRCELRRQDEKLIVEVFKLTCSVGCKKCLEVKDRTIAPDGEYYPCFLEVDKKCGNVCKDMKRAFEEGDIFIQNKAQRAMKDMDYEGKL